MIKVGEWAEVIRENGKGVAAAVVAVGALIGVDYSEVEANALVESLAQAAVAIGVVAVGVNVFVSKVKAAFKNDPDIDTGPTTPGPFTVPDPEE